MALDQHDSDIGDDDLAAGIRGAVDASTTEARFTPVAAATASAPVVAPAPTIVQLADANLENAIRMRDMSATLLKAATRALEDAELDVKAAQALRERIG